MELTPASPRADLLRVLPFFAELPHAPSTCFDLLGRARVEQRRAGEMIAERGAAAELIFLVRGAAELGGVRYEVGDVFGLAELLCDRPLPTAAVAVGDALLLRIDATLCGRLIEECTFFAREIVRASPGLATHAREDR